MIASGLTEKQLYQAIKAVNKKYNGNVCFNRYPEKVGKRFRFTLRVKDSIGKGAKRGFTGRKTIHACWHVHGDYFEECFKLNPEAVIMAGSKAITINEGNWQDRNIGSIMQPLYYSEACECE